MKIILEHLISQRPLVELCNEYGLRQSTYHYWLQELEKRGHVVFEYKKQNKKEQKLIEENKRLKQIMGNNYKFYFSAIFIFREICFKRLFGFAESFLYKQNYF
ncbi:MAG: hypothetical protein DRP80_00675 [Candidatus Omnitrophota bacterium]|nr:MAG: hypothetical protein DRP80_00675 [Candidatus Omnitrophota bacterium]